MAHQAETAVSKYIAEREKTFLNDPLTAPSQIMGYLNSVREFRKDVSVYFRKFEINIPSFVERWDKTGIPDLIGNDASTRHPDPNDFINHYYDKREIKKNGKWNYNRKVVTQETDLQIYRNKEDAIYWLLD